MENSETEQIFFLNLFKNLPKTHNHFLSTLHPRGPILGFYTWLCLVSNTKQDFESVL